MPSSSLLWALRDVARQERSCAAVAGREDFFGEEEEPPEWDVEAPWRPWAAEEDPIGRHTLLPPSFLCIRPLCLLNFVF